METINLEFKYTEAEAVRAVVEVTKSANKSIVIMPWIGGFLIVTIPFFAFTGGKDFFSFGVPLFFGILFISIPLLTFWNAKRDFRKNPSANKTIRWTISEQELKNETEGAETRFLWDKLIKVEERKSGFLLFPQPRLAHWIPKNSFRSDTEMNNFRNFVGNHGIKLKS